MSDTFFDRIKGACVIEKLHPKAATPKGKGNMERDKEGKMSLDMLIKLALALMVGVTAFGWNTIDKTRDVTLTNSSDIKLTQKDMEYVKSELKAHAELFVEMRGMIRRVEDQGGAGNAALGKVLATQNQILDELHWLKAAKMTKDEYEDYLKKYQQGSTSSSSSTPSSSSPASP